MNCIDEVGKAKAQDCSRLRLFQAEEIASASSYESYIIIVEFFQSHEQNQFDIRSLIEIIDD